MTIYALSLNLTVDEFESNYYERPEGSESKLSTFKDGFQIIKTIFRLLNDYKPFLVFSVTSSILFLLGIYLFIPIFNSFILTGVVDRLPTAVLSLGLVILAVISFFSGLILAGIKRHRLEAKKIDFLQFPK